jgi:hypothetical protein
MVEIDESELTNFFGVVQSSQSIEEKDFFGTMVFDVDRGGFHLNFSLSTYHPGLSVYLEYKPTGHKLLSVDLPGLRDIRVESLSSGISELLCRTVAAVGTLATQQSERVVHEIAVRVDPVISIRLRTEIDATD